MPNRQDLIEDLQRVDDETDSVIDPNQYDFLGSYEFEEIIEEFGNWNTALEEAGISLKKKLVKDVLRVSEEFDKNISIGDYRDAGNFRVSEIRGAFDSWNKLKRAAGLDINTKEVSLDELEKDMKKVAKKLDSPIAARDYNQHGKYSSGVLIQKDYTFAEFREKIGLEKPKGRISKDALEEWKEELKDVKGRFTLDELKKKTNDSNFPLTKRGVADLRVYLKDSEFQFNRTKGGSRTKYYLEGPEAQTLEEYYQQFLDRVPDDKEDWFMELSGTGTSPKTIAAAIRYLTEDKTQREIAEEEDTTEVSVRKAKNKIIERFDLDSEAGKDISNEDNISGEDVEYLEKFSEGDKDEINKRTKKESTERNVNEQSIGKDQRDKLDSVTERKVLDFFIEQEETLSYAEVSARMDLHRNQISEAISSLNEKGLLEHLDSDEEIVDYYKLK